MSELLKNRNFQLWEYCVSHGSLLIRSPKVEEFKENIDIKFYGVSYVAAPRFLGEVSLLNANDDELNSLSVAIGKPVAVDNAFVLESKGVRHLIVAVGVKIDANELDIFESPFK